LEKAFLHFARRSPESAGVWLEGLVRTIEALPDFPGPKSHPFAFENDRFDVEVRRAVPRE